MSKKEITWTVESARKANARAIAAALLTIGADCIIYSYNGSGDDGSESTVTALRGLSPEDEIELPTNPNVSAVREEYCTTLGRDVWKTATVTLETAMEAFGDSMVESLHDGYEDGDGGYGSVKIDAKGVVTYDHHDYIQETEDFSYVVDENGNATCVST